MTAVSTQCVRVGLHYYPPLFSLTAPALALPRTMFMMSQDRLAARDRLEARNDDETNHKAEEE